ncbi:hypothetical protein ABPG72_020680 [Tetrahymena utriculariae]
MGKFKIYDQSINQKNDQNLDNASQFSNRNTPDTSSLQNPKIEEKIMIYQVFPSSNIFLFGGRLIQGPQPRPFIFAILLIVVPVTLHMIFKLDYGYYQAIFTALTFAFMFKTAFQDPGIVPKADNLTKDQQIQEIPIDRTHQKRLGFLLIDQNGQKMNYKICDTCGIYKDNNRKHCRQCDNCVNGFDHHCIWLNNCIGRNNYRSFILFLFFLSTQLIFTITSCVYYLNNEILSRMDKYNEDRPQSTQNILKKEPLPIILIIYSSIFILMVGTLFIYHIILILQDTTTIEQKKRYQYTEKQQQNPIQINYWYSFKKKFLCISLKSYIHFRQYLEEKSSKKTNSPIKKDSESMTQVAAGKANVKNVENATQFLSNHKLQQTCINLQIEQIKDQQNLVFSSADDKQSCKKNQFNQESKDSTFQVAQQEIINNHINKKRSLQVNYQKIQSLDYQDLQKKIPKSINL